MKFDLKKYSHKGFAMHCPDEESAEIFLKFLHENGRVWKTTESYLENYEYDEYGSSTCYIFNKGTICDFEWLSQRPNDYYILNFYDFNWEDGTPEIFCESSESLECFLNDFTVVI